MTNGDWPVDAADAGVRLDKFLAAPNRMGSRARAVAALERRKVFVNDREATLSDAATRLATGDRVRVWMDRPGSAKPQARTTRIGKLEILFEDEALVVVNKPAGLLSVPLERKSAADSVLQPDSGSLPASRQAPSVCRASDRSRYVRAGAVREGRARTGSPERTIQAA